MTLQAMVCVVSVVQCLCMCRRARVW